MGYPLRSNSKLIAANWSSALSDDDSIQGHTGPSGTKTPVKRISYSGSHEVMPPNSDPDESEDLVRFIYIECISDYNSTSGSHPTLAAETESENRSDEGQAHPTVTPTLQKSSSKRKKGTKKVGLN